MVDHFPGRLHQTIVTLGFSGSGVLWSVELCCTSSALLNRHSAGVNSLGGSFSAASCI